MELVAGVKRVVVLMEHTAGGKPKLLKQCSLPLTGARVVDGVTTELGVLSIDRRGDGGVTLQELAPEVTTLARRKQTNGKPDCRERRRWRSEEIQFDQTG